MPRDDHACVSNDASSSRINVRRIIILSALLIGALLVRLPRLGESLWYDEIAAWMDYGVRGPHVILTTYFDPANHILHTLLTWISFNVFDRALAAEVALRLPALLFSLATVAVMFGLGRRRGGERTGVIAGFLAAAMPVLVLEGADARGYSMMIFFSAAATWQMLLAMENPLWRSWAIYSILCALGVWAHLMTMCIVVGHALWMMIELKNVAARVAVRGLFAVLGAGVFSIALYAPVLDDLLRIRGMFTAADGNEPSVFGLEGLHALMQFGGSWLWWCAAPGFALLLAGAVRMKIDTSVRRAVMPFLFAGVACALIITLANAWFYARFALFMMPGAIILTTAVVNVIWNRSSGLGLIVLAVITGAYAFDLALRPSRQPLREAVAFVRDAREPDDRLLVIGLRTPVLRVYTPDMHPLETEPLGVDLNEQLDQHDPEWIIMLYPRAIDDSVFGTLARRRYERAARFEGWADWGNGDVMVFQRVE